jgi:MFS transporter, FSR family, fosmidomycin resistance protein
MRLQIQPTLRRSLILLFVSHLILDFFTGIWPIYKTIAQIDLAKAGLIAGLSGFIGEFMQVFFGYFSDRGHRKKVIMLGLALSSCVLWITFTQDILSSFFVLLLLMLGSGSYHPAGAGFAGLLSPDHKGRNILFFACGGAIGLGISQLAFTKVFHLFSSFLSCSCSASSPCTPSLNRRKTGRCLSENFSNHCGALNVRCSCFI